MALYLHVTQDAGAVILFDRTPKEIRFLATNSLESCIAIMAKGKNGIALVHDSGKLTDASVKKIFQLIGEIEFWTTAFYPKADQVYQELNLQAYQAQFGAQGIYPTHFARISKIMSSMLQPGSKGHLPQGSYHEVNEEERMAAMDRDGKVYTRGSQFTAGPYVQPDLDLRAAISSLGHLKSPINCDLQFDGEKTSRLPELPMPIEVIKTLFGNEKIIRKLCFHYEKAKQEHSDYLDRLKEIMEKYKAGSAEQALRSAASLGKDQDVEFLVKKAGVNINEQGQKTGKTALHFAAANGHLLTFAILKALGAKDDIPDLKQVTAASILERQLKE
jgi:hypothetical protein